MKIQKGEPGYIKARRSRYLTTTVILLIIALILVVIGLNQTGSRLNVYTIVAILICLPACNSLTEFIAMFRLHSIEPKTYEEIASRTAHLTVLYDVVLTVDEKIMPVDVIVIYGHVICGYDTDEKTDETKVSTYLKQMLADNQIDKITVKIFSDYQPFQRRIDDLEKNAEEEGDEIHEREDSIKDLILSSSM